MRKENNLGKLVFIVNLNLTYKLYCSIFRYYLGLAKLAASNSCDPIPSRQQWLLTPEGYRFFLTQQFSFENKHNDLPFSSVTNPMDPLAYVVKVSFSYIFNFVRLFV